MNCFVSLNVNNVNTNLKLVNVVLEYIFLIPTP